jgi:hypothetical protein
MNARLESAADVDSGDRFRSLVSFDPEAIDSFIAGGAFTSATLILTSAESEHIPGDEDLIDVHPLIGGFAEGEGEVDAEQVAPGPIRPSAPGRPRLARRVGGRETAPGVTWDCAIDDNPGNEITEDCHDPWEHEGGDEGHATALPAAIGPAGAVHAWDVTEDVLEGVTAWLVRKRDESDPTGIAFHSREGAAALGDPSLAPTLVLE